MAEHVIKYRFTCEKCRNTTDWQEYRIVEDVKKEDSFVARAANAATFGASDAVLSKAELDFSIKRIKGEFEKGNYWKKLNGACPHCGYTQSWYQEPKMMTGGQLFLSVLLRICLWEIPALIVGIILYLVFDESELGLVIPPALAFILPLFFGIKNGVRELKENREVFKPALSRPEIDWNDEKDVGYNAENTPAAGTVHGVQNSRGAVSQTDQIKGIRTFIMTTGMLLDPNDQIHKQIIDQMYNYALGLMRHDEVFESKYQITKAHNTPHKIGFGQVKNPDQHFACFAQWQKNDGYGIGVPGVSTFVQAGDAQEPTSGAKLPWCVLIYFVE